MDPTSPLTQEYDMVSDTEYEHQVSVPNTEIQTPDVHGDIPTYRQTDHPLTQQPIIPGYPTVAKAPPSMLHLTPDLGYSAMDSVRAYTPRKQRDHYRDTGIRYDFPDSTFNRLTDPFNPQPAELSLIHPSLSSMQNSGYMTSPHDVTTHLPQPIGVTPLHPYPPQLSSLPAAYTQRPDVNVSSAHALDGVFRDFLYFLQQNPSATSALERERAAHGGANYHGNLFPPRQPHPTTMTSLPLRPEVMEPNTFVSSQLGPPGLHTPTQPSFQCHPGLDRNAASRLACDLQAPITSIGKIHEDKNYNLDPYSHVHAYPVDETYRSSPAIDCHYDPMPSLEDRSHANINPPAGSTSPHIDVVSQVDNSFSQPESQTSDNSFPRCITTSDEVLLGDISGQTSENLHCNGETILTHGERNTGSVSDRFENRSLINEGISVSSGNAPGLSVPMDTDDCMEIPVICSNRSDEGVLDYYGEQTQHMPVVWSKFDESVPEIGQEVVLDKHHDISECTAPESQQTLDQNPEDKEKDNNNNSGKIETKSVDKAKNKFIGQEGLNSSIEHPGEKYTKSSIRRRPPCKTRPCVTNGVRLRTRRRFCCLFCGSTYRKAVSLRHHRLRAHNKKNAERKPKIKPRALNDKQKTTCQTCGYVALNWFSLSCHERGHQRTDAATGKVKPHFCLLCPSFFVHPTTTRDHVTRCHGKKAPHKNVFVHTQAVKPQRNSATRGKLDCEFCPERLTSQHELDIHVHWHLVEAVRHQSDEDAEGLQLHVYNRKHADVPDWSFTCSVCGKMFRYESAFLHHCSFRHRKNIRKQIITM